MVERFSPPVTQVFRARNWKPPSEGSAVIARMVATAASMSRPLTKVGCDWLVISVSPVAERVGASVWTGACPRDDVRSGAGSARNGPILPQTATGMTPGAAPLKALIVALPETAGSALYGMVDVLSAAGSLYEELS